MLRRKSIHTLHGQIQTPAFLPDATYGAINSLSFADADSAGVEEIVTTTMHLELKLGADYIAKMGGLHKFFNWSRPILTDSGGFQVFSLIHRRNNPKNRILPHGASFADPATGRNLLLTPALSQEIQAKLSSDIRVVLDEPVDNSVDESVARASVERTIAWAKDSRQAFLALQNLSGNPFSQSVFDQNESTRPLLTAVIQGAGSKELRKRCTEELVSMGFDGYNLGGLSQTPEGKLDLELIQFIANLIPADKIRYAMGVGTPDDIWELAHMGWDIFDCVLPTRNARHGFLFVEKGEGDAHYNHYDVLHLRSERYKFADEPIANDTHPVLKNVSRAYLRHLIRIKEPSGFRLATLS